MNSHFNLLAPFYDRVIRFDRLEQMLESVGSALRGQSAGRRRRHRPRGGGAPPTCGLGRCRRCFARDAGSGPSKGFGRRLHCDRAFTFFDNTFDRVLMVDALHHVLDQAETIRELFRVLKVGGRLVIEEPDLRTFAVKLIAVAEKLALMRSHFLAPLQIAQLFPAEAKVRIEAEENTAWMIAEK